VGLISEAEPTLNASVAGDTSGNRKYSFRQFSKEKLKNT